MFLIILTILITIPLSLYFWIKHKLTFHTRYGYLHKKPRFLFGNHAIDKKFHETHHMDLMYKEYKSQAPAFGTYNFIHPTVVITDLDVVKSVLIKDFEYFRNRSVFHDEKTDPLSATLFAIKDEPWRNLRNNLTPTFTSGKMKGMFNIVLNVSDQLVHHMQNQEEVVEVKEILAKFTTDVIGNIAFGLESDALKNPDSIFRKMGLKFFDFSGKRGLQLLVLMMFENIGKLLGYTLTPKEVEEFFMNTIRETMNYRQQNNIERKDFFDLLLKIRQDGKQLPFNELAAQSFIFWVAGFETSSSTGTFMLYLLATHPDIQEELRTEIQKVVARHDNNITYDAIMEMKYLQKVLDETLRMYGPVFHLMRTASADYTIPNTNLKIPKDTRILIPTHSIHYDEEYYEEPHKFDPERFNEDNKKNRHPMAHLPFGDGPRNCIGMRFGVMQTKIAIVQLLLQFKFSPSSRTTIPLEIHPQMPILSPKDDMWLTVEKI